MDGTKETTAVAQKDLGINSLAEMWKAGLDTDRGAPERPRHPFSQVDWVYICVKAILDTCAGIQMALSTANDEIVESGPVYDFLYRNQDMPLDDFLTQTVGYVALFKEAYWVFTGTDGIRPTDILIAGPDQLKPVIRRGVLVGYELRQAGGRRIPLFIEDVHPLLGFNPDSPYRGVGPLTAGKLAISSSYQATLFNESSLANGARISTLLSYPAGTKLDPDEKQWLIAQFEARHKGARNAGKTFLSTGGADVKTLSQTMADLQMIELRKFDAATICALFGVPGEIVGLNAEAQYAHGPASQRFITNTIAPLLAFVGRHITLGILGRFRFKSFDNKSVAYGRAKVFSFSRMPLKARPTYRRAKIKAVQSGQGLFAWFAVDDHPAVQEMLRDRADKMIKYAEKGVPLNQIIAAGDLPFEEVEWGNDWWIPLSLVPASWQLQAGPESIIDEPLPEGGGETEAGKAAADPDRQKATEQQKRRIWTGYKNSWRGIEQEFKGRVRTNFMRQERELIAKLKKAWAEHGGKSICEKGGQDIVARVVFDLKKEKGKLKVINKVFFEKASRLGVAQSLNELEGLTGEQLVAAVKPVERSAVIRRALQVSSQKIGKVAETVQRQISSGLADGLEKGEGLGDLTKRVRGVMKTSRARAQSIARTQVSGAVSTGRHAGMKAAGVELKGWLSSRDDNVRAAHKQAEKDYAGGITLNQPFVVGGEALMYPADPNGSAAMIINCRCLQIAIRAKGKNFSLGHYERVKFISHQECESLFREAA